MVELISLVKGTKFSFVVLLRLRITPSLCCSVFGVAGGFKQETGRGFFSVYWVVPSHHGWANKNNPRLLVKKFAKKTYQKKKWVSLHFNQGNCP